MMEQILWWQFVIAWALWFAQSPNEPHGFYWLCLGVWQFVAVDEFFSYRFIFCMIVIEITTSLVKDNERIRFGYINYWMNLYMAGFDKETCHVEAKSHCDLTRELVQREKARYEKFFNSNGFIVWSNDPTFGTGTLEGDTETLNGVSLEL